MNVAGVLCCRFCRRPLPPGLIDVDHTCVGAEAWHAEQRERARRGERRDISVSWWWGLDEPWRPAQIGGAA